MKQWKNKITNWGFDKKLKKCEVNFVISQRLQRRKIGKASAFRIRGDPLDETRIARYLKRTHKIQSDIGSREISPALSTCSAMSCYTPKPSSPLDVAVSDQVFGSKEIVHWPNDKNHRPRSMAHVPRSTSRGHEGSTTMPQTLVGKDRDYSQSVRENGTMQLATIVSASVVPRVISNPSLYMISERIFGNITLYFSEIFASQYCSSKKHSSRLPRRRMMEPQSWMGFIKTANKFLSVGQSKKAREALGLAYIELERPIRSQSLRFIPALLDILNESAT